ncbi:MAG: hypothetical protein ACRD4O_01445 [Bryobacteraceae bacterium]
MLGSISRVASQVAAPEHLETARKVREALACYCGSEDLIQLGAYASGSNPKLDASIRAHERTMGFLRQGSQEKFTLDETLRGLAEIGRAL